MPRQNDRLIEEKQGQQALRELARELRQTPHRMEVWFAELHREEWSYLRNGILPVLVVSDDSFNVPSTISAGNAGVDLYKTIFSGNPIVKDVRDAVDHTGTHHGFVRFAPEVIQFFNDDISDFNGNWSGLAQDIAREVFTNDSSGIHFCTAGLNEGTKQ